jgi:AraC-like DNA-binding protein
MGRPWSIAFADQQGGIKCNAMLSGESWIIVERADPVLVRAGDVFLLPSGRPFQIASKLGLRSVPAEEVIKSGSAGLPNRLGAGGDATLISCRFSLVGRMAGFLLDQLPPVVLMRAGTNDAERIKQFVELLVSELVAGEPGSELVVQHLSHLILLYSLRFHQKGASQSVGWLYAATNRRVGTALMAIHTNPAHKWTLENLADLCAMSRATFARQFKLAVGEAPMEYVARWRMMLAGDRLSAAEQSTGEIAASLGYDSENGFRTAFKRVMGVTPGSYGRQERSQQVAA